MTYEAILWLNFLWWEGNIIICLPTLLFRSHTFIIMAITAEPTHKLQTTPEIRSLAIQSLKKDHIWSVLLLKYYKATKNVKDLFIKFSG